MVWRLDRTRWNIEQSSSSRPEWSFDKGKPVKANEWRELFRFTSPRCFFERVLALVATGHNMYVNRVYGDCLQYGKRYGRWRALCLASRGTGNLSLTVFQDPCPHTLITILTPLIRVNWELPDILISPIKHWQASLPDAVKQTVYFQKEKSRTFLCGAVEIRFSDLYFIWVFWIRHHRQSLMNTYFSIKICITDLQKMLSCSLGNSLPSPVRFSAFKQLAIDFPHNIPFRRSIEFPCTS